VNRERAADEATRLHALDALRGLAIGLVVVGHGVMSYATPAYGPVWVVRVPPEEASWALGGIFWWLHGFRLPLYFVLAGFFAARLSASRGPHGFIRQRVARILVPFVAGVVVLLPICVSVFAFGWWVSPARGLQREVWGPLHLWFLEYLFLYAVLYWAVARARPRARERPVWPLLARCLTSRWRALWCALPTALVIGLHPEVVTTHHNRFVPEPFEFVHYGIYFAWGVYFHRVDASMARLGAAGGRYVVASFGVFVVVAALLARYLAGTLPGWGRIALAGALALFAWCSIFGYLGVAQRLFARRSTLMRYLADAAYWVYLIHLPVVALLQIALTAVPMPIVIKAALAIGATTAVCLWSYERWVRYGVVGAALNGPREREAAVAASPSARTPAVGS
jgi:peptidoglycan/LPS O-acetylase OafA/YrhL